MSRFAFVLLASFLLAVPALAGGVEVGRAGGDFSLAAGDRAVSLSGLLGKDDTQAVVVAFTSYTCPYSLRADRELKTLITGCAERGVVFVSIYPNRHETAAGLKEYAARQELGHALVCDPGGKVARAFGVEVTPTFFLFDKSGTLRYRGNLGGLSPAADAVLAGDAVARATTPATGCTVKWPEAAVPDTPRGDGGAHAGPDGDVPPRETPRRGPPDAEPPALSAAASRMLSHLIGLLGSDDPMVNRSAAAGILAFGPAARPKLEEARKSAEGPAKREIKRILDRMAEAGRRGPEGRGPEGRRPGGPGGGFRGRGSILEMQRQRIEAALDLTDEQKQQVAELFDGLKGREQELVRMREGGDREGMREAYGQLMLEVSDGLSRILTPEQAALLKEMRERRPGGPGGGRGRNR
jgi:peroxiredoxin/Spy/CpxP family protein refolding chaperone